MGASDRALTAVMVFSLLLAATASAAMSTRLEIFAGEDKVTKAGEVVNLVDARIVYPDPPDPDLTYSFRWDFDDRRDIDLDGIYDNDGESHERYANWRYTVAGTYTVTLTVTDGTLVGKDKLQVTVVPNYPPTLRAAQEQVAILGVPSELNATAEDRDDGVDSLVWTWSLGDGTQDDGPAPICHVYDQVGRMRVTVQVRDPAGNFAVASFNVTVEDVTKPVCDAGPDVSITVNDTVVFNGGHCSDNVGITSWTWTFRHNGSLVKLEGPTPEFTFTSEGTFVVGLRVEDAGGNEATDTVMVLVRPVDADSSDGSTAATPREPVQGWSVLATVIVVAFSFIASSGLVARARETISSERDIEIFFRRGDLHRR